MGAKYCVAEMSLSLRQGKLLPAVLTAGDGESGAGRRQSGRFAFPEEDNGAVISVPQPRPNIRISLWGGVHTRRGE